MLFRIFCYNYIVLFVLFHHIRHIW